MLCSDFCELLQHNYFRAGKMWSKCFDQKYFKQIYTDVIRYKINLNIYKLKNHKHWRLIKNYFNKLFFISYYVGNPRNANAYSFWY